MDDTKKSIILIVDDNFENLQVLGNTLKERGYIPAFAQSGEIALNYLKKKKRSQARKNQRKYNEKKGKNQKKH